MTFIVTWNDGTTREVDAPTERRVKEVFGPITSKRIRSISLKRKSSVPDRYSTFYGTTADHLDSLTV